MTYVSLHTHSHYSLMDGVATAQEYVDRAVALGMPAIAITDHGTLSGHADFYRACTAAGIKPILGIEAYYCADRFDRRDRADRTEPLDTIYNHLTLLAKDESGLRNLHRLSELAWTEGYFHKPRIDWQLLNEFGDGLIVLSGCMSGVLNKALEANEPVVAKIFAQKFKDRFGDDFYIEVMPHNPGNINEQLISIADQYKIKTVVTPDCHHATPDQKEIQEFTLLLNTHAKPVPDTTYKGSTTTGWSMMDRLDYLYGTDRKMSFRNFDIHLLSENEMYDGMYPHVTGEMFDSTLEIADKIGTYTIPEGLDVLPVEYADPDKTLRGYAIAGLKAMDLDGQEYKDRLDEELRIIKEKGFAPYFLMVRNVTNYAHQKNILMSPGRGSAAGSLVAYSLGITNVDPIEHGLLFFRFIDPSRNDMPDIDMDFEDTRRDEIKEFIARKYGHVASIATFNAFGDKTVVRDVARVLRVPLDRVNSALRNVETWDDFINSKHESVVSFRADFPDVVHTAELLHGRIRTTGIHAAGVVASKVPLNEVAPIETRSVGGRQERLTIVAVDKDEAERIGLVKMDILGLKTLTVIQDTLKNIKERHGKDIDLLSLEPNGLDSIGVWEMLNNGLTKGVFQLEAGPYTNLVVKMGVWSFNELAASNALVRPGAANTIGKDYIARKNGKQTVTYIHPSMKPYLENTFGCVLYQEQVMQACVVLGDMTMGEANKVRKIIGKKKDRAEFDEFKSKFVQNASTKIGTERAEALWHDFEAHAGYSFNLSHAVAYSTLSWWTAWLKCNYTLEFFQALLANEKDPKTVPDYLIEAKRMGIRIKFPHVNLSDVSWKIEGDALRFGLKNIKYISDISAQRFIDARPFESYDELEQFVFKKGTGVNSRALEAMRKVGAANLPGNEVSVQEQLANAYEYLGLPSFSTVIPAHWNAKLTAAEDYVDGDVAVMQGYVRDVKLGKGWQLYDVMDSTGSFKFFGRKGVDVEVGKSYLFVLADKAVVSAVDTSELNGTTVVEQYLDGSQAEGFILAAQSRLTKTNQRMGTVVVDRGGELIAATLFPRNFGTVAPLIRPGGTYHVDISQTRTGGYAINGVKSVA